MPTILIIYYLFQLFFNQKCHALSLYIKSLSKSNQFEVIILGYGKL